MKSYEADKQGLDYVGFYESWGNKEKVKEKAKNIRTTYKCRAVVVEVDSGYVVYADRKYFDLTSLERYKTTLSYMARRKEELLKRYLDGLKALEEEENQLKEKINNIKERYSI